MDVDARLELSSSRVGRPTRACAAAYAIMAYGLAASPATAARPQTVEDLKQLSIEDLANVEITSVFKRSDR